jgi:methylated-DNA-[protein]-cysteine S-methyltransferase
MRTSTRRAEQAPSGSRREVSFETPFGPGRLTLEGDLPLELELPAGTGRAAAGGASAAGRPAADTSSGAAATWVARLEAYFAGEPVAFDLDVAAHCRARGMTAFETAVYTALAAVPYGRAVSYRDLAHAAGRPNAYRAVGTAMSHNVLPVILPCHRVIKNDGTPGQYGEDPTWKLRLLELEGVLEPGATKVARAGRGRD